MMKKESDHQQKKIRSATGPNWNVSTHTVCTVLVADTFPGLLAPLTAASELPNHPSLSIPYISRSLTEMAENARELVYREKEALWRAKQMLQRFRGDEMWIPLENMETYQDSAIFDPTDQPLNDTDPCVNDSSMSIDQQGPATMETTQTAPPLATNGDSLSTQDGEVNGIKAVDMATRKVDAEKSIDKQGVQDSNARDERIEEDTQAQTKENATGEQADEAEAMQIDGANPDEQPTTNDGESDAAAMGNGHSRDSSPESANGHIQHRMTTRAKARTTPSPAAHTSPSPSPVPSSIPSVHPLFQFPAASLPDRDFGLPAQEAEDTRRVLVLYVQKQEQVVREAEDLLQGLLKADRLRKDVFRWCKAEGHVGEMSDGEDWYDPEEWQLDELLKKGKEEEDVEEEGRGKRKGRRGAGGKI